MNFFRKILGLGPKEPINVIHNKKTPPIKVVEEPILSLNEEEIFPILLSEKTKTFDLNDQLVAIFHERENNYANVIITHILLDKTKVDENGDVQVSYINTTHQSDEAYRALLEYGKRNFDNLDEIPFEFWNPVDKALDYQVLSCKKSHFAPQKIMSKKHMLEAHKLLNTDELLVSIPRRAAIFVCDNKIAEEHRTSFFKLHAYLVLDDNEEMEFLCEDIFVVKNGEIEQVYELPQLSEALRAKE